MDGVRQGCGWASAGPPYDVSRGERVARRREPAGDVRGAGGDRAGLDRLATLFFGYFGSYKKRTCWFISGTRRVVSAICYRSSISWVRLQKKAAPTALPKSKGFFM